MWKLFNNFDLDQKNDKSKELDENNKYVSFGDKNMKPPIGNSKVSKNLADIEALLEYDGEDIDQLAMGSSKDALRIIDSLEDMLDARINFLTENDQNNDNYSDNLLGLACF